jgi:UDP-3-O-[3-hydroxymyristoyl] glucosamine N-acyltransferase
MKVRELADWLACTFEGDGEREITGVGALEAAGAAEISFIGNRRAAAQAAQSAAGCLVVPLNFANEGGRTVIRARDPRGTFARTVSRFHPVTRPAPGVHPTAVVAEDAELGEGVTICANAVIGAESRIGAGTVVGPGSSVGQRVSIGADSTLHANVSIYDDVEIGDRAVLHSGCVIGADGFGFVLSGERYEKFPQVGRVHLGDDCEIGANACIDRAALGVTWLGDGVKIDNMVHVGHNCSIGNHVVVAAQTGFSGGVIVEDYAVIGGQVGIGDKARIESRAVLGSGCGVLTSKVIRAGEVVWGTPARPLKEILEQLANLAKLPEMREEIAQLKVDLALLQSKES